MKRGGIDLGGSKASIHISGVTQKSVSAGHITPHHTTPHHAAQRIQCGQVIGIHIRDSSGKSSRRASSIHPSIHQSTRQPDPDNKHAHTDRQTHTPHPSLTLCRLPQCNHTKRAPFYLVLRRQARRPLSALAPPALLVAIPTLTRNIPTHPIHLGRTTKDTPDISYPSIGTLTDRQK